MGYIGLGNRGDQVHDAFLEHGDQVTAAVCDLRDDYMEFAIKKSHATPKKYKEYKQLLADKEIDAVVIATPDHWHAPMFINACNAGKDVYVEKPLSLTVAEGRHMVETADRTKRVVQVGTNRRSWKTYREMIDFVHAGGIGKISVGKAFSIRNEWPQRSRRSYRRRSARIEWQWDHWLGPAPKVPYNSNRTFYNFRWFYNYSGGQLTNFGVHYMDIIRWAMGKDSPRAVFGNRRRDSAGLKTIARSPTLWKWCGITAIRWQLFRSTTPTERPAICAGPRSICAAPRERSTFAIAAGK